MAGQICPQDVEGVDSRRICQKLTDCCAGRVPYTLDFEYGGLGVL